MLFILVLTRGVLHHFLEFFFFFSSQVMKSWKNVLFMRTLLQITASQGIQEAELLKETKDRAGWESVLSSSPFSSQQASQVLQEKVMIKL